MHAPLQRVELSLVLDPPYDGAAERIGIAEPGSSAVVVAAVGVAVAVVNRCAPPRPLLDALPGRVLRLVGTEAAQANPQQQLRFITVRRE